jgi:hypothetical protein
MNIHKLSRKKQELIFQRIALMRFLFHVPYQFTINVIDTIDNIDIGIDLDEYDI